ncbi:hypothetical protein C4K15_2773 [Pseudomonas chlororaphis subsp. aurantiaca]|nr:hypothetical protein C4K15_2773 [Pseudomonas chlororaphis subsp. aurantiaca]
MPVDRSLAGSAAATGTGGVWPGIKKNRDLGRGFAWRFEA